MHPQLDDIQSQLHAASDKAQALVARLTPEQFTTRASVNSWSIAECIEHLTLATDNFLTLLRDGLARARREGLIGSGPYKLDFWGRLLVWYLEPPYRTRSKAVPKFTPAPIVNPDRVLPGFLDRQRQFYELLREADGLALDRIRVQSPVDARLSYSAYSALRITAAHQRRHLWQAERVLARLSSG